MLYKLILLQLTAHLIADFILQPQVWSDKKRNKIFSIYHVYHVLVVLCTSFVFSLNFKFWIASITISILHLLTDVVKSYFQLRTNIENKRKNYFFTDQAVHIISILAICFAYSKCCNIDFIIDLSLKSIAIVAAIILCAKPANIIIKHIFIFCCIETPVGISSTPDCPIPENDDDEEKSLPNAGKLIGIMERFLALALIISGQFGAVGLIIAAKSVLRFNDTQKNEYILVGTLLSFGIAVLSGIIILKLKI